MADEDRFIDLEDKYKSSKRKRHNSDYGEESEKFRKLFVGGLSYDTTDEQLKAYFEQFGVVEDCIVMKEPGTKRSRGFGFVTYKEAKMLEHCQSARPHTLDNRLVDTKRAMPKTTGGIVPSEVKESVHKLFVGGIRDITTADRLKEEFEIFGRVKHVELMMDKVTGRHRGFAFVTFEDTDSVDKAVLKKHFDVDGKMVEVKKAESRQNTKRNMGRSGFGNMGNSGMGNMGMGNAGMGNAGMGNMGMRNTGMGNAGMGNAGMGNMGMGNMGMGNMGMGNMGNMGWGNPMGNMGWGGMGWGGMGNMGWGNMGMGNMGSCNPSGNMPITGSGAQTSGTGTDVSNQSAMATSQSQSMGTCSNQNQMSNQQGMGMIGNQMGMMGMNPMGNQMGMMGNMGMGMNPMAMYNPQMMGMMGYGNNPMGNQMGGQMMNQTGQMGSQMNSLQAQSGTGNTVSDGKTVTSGYGMGGQQMYNNQASNQGWGAMGDYSNEYSSQNTTTNDVKSFSKGIQQR